MDFRNSSNNNAVKQQNNYTPKPTIRKVQVKLNTGQESEVEISIPNNLPGSFVIFIGSGKHRIQYTIHRPVGITDLDPELDWVCTQTTQVSMLLARMKDPDQEEVNKRVQTARNELLISAKFLESIEGELFYPGIKEASRKHFVQEADDAFKKAKKAETDNNRKRNIERINYFPKEVIDKEAYIQNFLEDDSIRESLAISGRQTFRTMSGPRQNIAQNAFFRSKTEQEAYDFVVRSIHITFVPTGTKSKSAQQQSTKEDVAQAKASLGDRIKAAASSIRSFGSSPKKTKEQLQAPNSASTSTSIEQSTEGENA